MSINQRGRKLELIIDNPRGGSKKSSKQDKNIFLNDQGETEDEASNELLSKILDAINSNSLNIFYSDSNSDFKKKIDSLNLKFYLETEKYLSNKNRSEKCQTSLFIILFKQINIYIEEIERLNLIIIKGKYDPKKIIERTDQIIKKQNEFLTKEKLIKTLKESKSNIETKLLESIINEDKLKKEIQTLKKENAIFKKQLSKNLDKHIRKNMTNNINTKGKKMSQNDLLHKLTYPAFHLSNRKNLINDENIPGAGNINIENKVLCYNQVVENGGNIRKRNNSDNNKTLLNNSFKKFEKLEGNRKGRKLLFNKILKNKENSKNNAIINNSSVHSNHRVIVKNSQLSNYNYLNKKTIHIELKNGNENKNNANINYFGDNKSQSINMTSNLDLGVIKPVKTEYIISDLDDYKKGVLYEYNSSVLSLDNRKNNHNKGFNAKFISISKEKNDKNAFEKNNIGNKKNKEKKVSSSSKQISSFIGKTSNERKKSIYDYL